MQVKNTDFNQNNVADKPAYPETSHAFINYFGVTEQAIKVSTTQQICKGYPGVTSIEAICRGANPTASAVELMLFVKFY